MATIAGLYALTPDLLDTDELVTRVAAAIAGGAAAVQYRNKIASPPLRRAQALVLRDLEGLSNVEIAEALGMSIPNVKSRVHRARLFLRKRLTDTMAAPRYTSPADLAA